MEHLSLVLHYLNNYIQFMDQLLEEKTRLGLPLMFTLMTNQTENSYKLMFTDLNDFAIEHNIYFKDNTDLKIITDF